MMCDFFLLFCCIFVYHRCDSPYDELAIFISFAFTNVHFRYPSFQSYKEEQKNTQKSMDTIQDGHEKMNVEQQKNSDLKRIRF